MNQASATPHSSGTPFPRTPQIIFANWREALHQSGLSSGIQTVYRLAVQGYLRTVQDLLGHVDVATTQIYTHVMNRPGLGIWSPLDARQVES